MEKPVSRSLFKRRSGIRRLDRRLPYRVSEDDVSSTLHILSRPKSLALIDLELHFYEEKRRNNAAAAIHRLPTELVNLILDLTIPDFSHDRDNWDDSYIQHFRLVSVCSFWKTMLESLPRFWTVVSNSFPKGLVRKALRLSQTQPLSVQITASTTDTPAHSEQLDRRTAMILQHAGRIRTLALQSNRPQDFQFLREIETPLLQRVMATNTNKDSHLQIVPSTGFKTVGNLTVLHVSGCRLDWHSGIPTQLQSLTVLGRYVVSTEEILDILVENPGLLELTLRSINPPPASTQTDIPLISLPVLKTLRIHHLDVSFCGNILPHLQIPAGVFLSSAFDTNIEENMSNASLIQSLRSIGLLPRSLIFCVKYEPSSGRLFVCRLRIHLASEPRNLDRTKGRVVILRIDAPCPLSDAVSNLGTSLGVDVVRQLPVGVQLIEDGTVWWTAGAATVFLQLTILPNIASIRVPRLFLKEFITHLCRPSLDGDWPLPNLTHLSMDFVDTPDLKLITETLPSRSIGGSTPLPMNVLEMRSVTREVLQQLPLVDSLVSMLKQTGGVLSHQIEKYKGFKCRGNEYLSDAVSYCGSHEAFRIVKGGQALASLFN